MVKKNQLKKERIEKRQQFAVFFFKQQIKAKDSYQQEFLNNIQNRFITFGLGAAGTGKTLLALYMGFKFILNPESKIEKIYYIRSNVGLKDEKDLGILPGTYEEKIAHLGLPLLDNLTELLIALFTSG